MIFFQRWPYGFSYLLIMSYLNVHFTICGRLGQFFSFFFSPLAIASHIILAISLGQIPRNELWRIWTQKQRQDLNPGLSALRSRAAASVILLSFTHQKFRVLCEKPGIHCPPWTASPLVVQDDLAPSFLFHLLSSICGSSGKPSPGTALGKLVTESSPLSAVSTADANITF